MGDVKVPCGTELIHLGMKCGEATEFLPNEPIYCFPCAMAMQSIGRRYLALREEVRASCIKSHPSEREGFIELYMILRKHGIIQ